MAFLEHKVKSEASSQDEREITDFEVATFENLEDISHMDDSKPLSDNSKMTTSFVTRRKSQRLISKPRKDK